MDFAHSDLTEAQRFLSALDPNPNAQFVFATFDDNHDSSDYRLATRSYGLLEQGIHLSGPTKGNSCHALGTLGFTKGACGGGWV